MVKKTPQKTQLCSKQCVWYVILANKNIIGTIVSNLNYNCPETDYANVINARGQKIVYDVTWFLKTTQWCITWSNTIDIK